MKVFPFSPPGLFSQCWHSRVAILLRTLLKALTGQETALEDIKHPASLWSYPGSSGWVLCFCSPVHHILLVESSLLQTLSYLFHKGKRVLDRKRSSFSVGETKKTCLSSIMRNLCRHIGFMCISIVFTSYCYVFSILNVFVKLSRLYLRKPTETH